MQRPRVNKFETFSVWTPNLWPKHDLKISKIPNDSTDLRFSKTKPFTPSLKQREMRFTHSQFENIMSKNKKISKFLTIFYNHFLDDDTHQWYQMSHRAILIFIFSLWMMILKIKNKNQLLSYLNNLRKAIIVIFFLKTLRLIFLLMKRNYLWENSNFYEEISIVGNNLRLKKLLTFLFQFENRRKLSRFMENKHGRVLAKLLVGINFKML